MVMRKRYGILFFFLVGVVIVHGQGFTVKNFTADIYINTEGYFDVVEKYDVVFDMSKHGIYRDIITTYDFQDVGSTEITKRKIYITDISVPGNKFTVSQGKRQGKTTQTRIKIGDKNKTILGPKTYEIRYRVKNAFLFNEEDDFSIFYWNVKAGEWDAWFDKLSFNIHVPDEVDLSEENSFLYDNIASRNIEQYYDLSYKDGVFSAVSKDQLRYSPNHLVTVQINMPYDLIKQVDFSPPIWKEYSWAGVLALLLALFWWIWDRYGKDDKVVATTSYYAPDNIDPAMAGYLLKDKVNPSQLVAMIPHWGSMGYIKVEEIPKKGIFSRADMKLIKKENLPADILPYESIFFDGLFRNRNEILVSDLRESFYKTMNSAKSSLKRNAKVYYNQKSERIKNIVTFVSVIGLVGVPYLFHSFFGFVGTIVAEGVLLFIVFMSFYLRKKNQRGNEAYSELLGFRNFIKIAELPQIEMLLKDDPQYFEKTMGYAVAFGLLGKWASKFDALNMEPPEWYSSPTGIYTMNSFSKSFSTGIANVQSAMVSTPSSSGGGSFGGGGSAGGGFGGGGGGSW